jgi:hexosaminidase
MTALQLLESSGKDGVPCVSILDYPRFAHRGILLDPARHFLSVKMVKSVIDQMSQLKFNVLHFHLVDDQGWRFESKVFPKLQQVGGAGGYYTQEELRDLVAYGQARYVVIMPEIEMPGHSRAMLASYPELSCSGEKLAVASGVGIFSTALCPGKPEVYDFLDKLVKEVAGIFPSFYIHTGSDEVQPKDWQTYGPNLDIEKTLAEKNDKGLQCYFINKVNQAFLSINRRMTVWDEMVDCLPQGARVQAWRSIAAAKTAAEAKHEVVVSLVNPWYLDYPDWPWQLKKVYAFDPVPKDLSPDLKKYIVGGEGNLWGERAPENKIMPKLFPRIIAIAEVLWSPKESRDYKSFKRREKIIRESIEKQGVKFFIWLNIQPM